MDVLFTKEINRLINTISLLNTSEEEGLTGRDKKLLLELGKIARRLDTIYLIAVKGFEYVNKKASDALHEVVETLIAELEEKELLIEEGEGIINTTEIDIEEIMEYGKSLSLNSKCPLLWTEEMPLDRLPAYPVDSLIQQSVLRMHNEEDAI